MMRPARPLPGLERLLSALQRGHLPIALLTLAVLALLVVPVSPAVLDVAIATSFLSALLLLMATLQVRRPVDFSAFPALLLAATLLRLAIAVASTRMILVEARAGEIVHALGTVAAGANVLVGLVVFVVLGVVQFVVIAKGGDRVAEVAARFTLDSIPGRQMSIDADLRAGVLGAGQASARRQEMERETYLYGAMDGAMKFVKGDSIATFLVALVNLAGGIGVGVLQRGQELGAALHSYTILTIGDGLVAQIPSLLSAMAAALLITRVSASDDAQGGNLATEVATQLARLPAALAITAGLLVAIGLLPGMPAMAFLPTGLALGAMTIAIVRRARLQANSQRALMPAMTRDGGAYVPRILDDIELGTSAPLRVRLSPDALRALSPEAFNAPLETLRRHLTLTTGTPFPGLSLLRDELLPSGYYVVDIEETPHESGVLVAGQVMVSSQETPLPEAPGGYRPGYAHSRWLTPEAAAACQGTDVARADPDEALCLHLLEVCQQRAAHFLGLQETRFLLTQLGREFDALVSQFETRVGAIALAATLRALLADGLSIRNLRQVLDAALSIPASTLNQDRLLRQSRIALGGQICARYREDVNRPLRAEILEPAWQAALEGCVLPGPEGEPQFLPTPELLAAIAPLAAQRRRHAMPLLVSAMLRPHLAMLLAATARAPVLAFEEIHAGGCPLQVERCHLGP